MGILSVTVPLFIFLILGYICRRTNVINDKINDFLSKVVYYAAFPALTFQTVGSSNFKETFNFGLVTGNLLTVFGVFVITFGFSFLIGDKRKRGAFNISSFRSNQGYIGIPVILGFYGTQAMAKTAIVNSFDSVNVVIWSVLALEIFKVSGMSGVQDSNEQGSKWKSAFHTGRRMLFNVITNPFIIAAVAGLIVSYFQIPILNEDGLIYKTLTLASGTALPLSLMMVGASVELKTIKSNLGLVLEASFFKLIFAPILAFALGMLFGLRGVDLGVCMLLGAMPSAVSSYVMAKEMGADEDLCAAIIGFTTFASIFTISIFKFIFDAHFM